MKKLKKYQKAGFTSLLPENIRPTGNMETGINALWEGVKILDPTGISSWQDAYETFQNPNASGIDKGFALLSSLPIVGKFGKGLKAAKKFSELSKLGKVKRIATAPLNILKPVELAFDRVPSNKKFIATTGKVADRLVGNTKLDNSVNLVAAFTNAANRGRRFETLNRNLADNQGVTPLDKGFNTLIDFALPQKKRGGTIVDPQGQYNHPGSRTIVPTETGRITMKGVPYPVFGQDETGHSKVMLPNGEYQFPGRVVDEIPLLQKGGNTQEMITGIADILKQVKSKSNRRSIFNNVLQDLDQEGTKYNKAEFQQLAHLQKGGRPTTADSLELYNAQVALNKFYEDEARNKNIKNKNISSFYGFEGIANLQNENLDFYRNLIKRRQTLGKGAFQDDYKKFFGTSPSELKDLELKGLAKTKSASSDKLYYRDLITPMQNLKSPIALVDKRINPDRVVSYEPSDETYPGGFVSVFDYDPIRIKPYNMLTPAEKVIREKKYPSKITKDKIGTKLPLEKIKNQATRQIPNSHYKKPVQPEFTRLKPGFTGIEQESNAATPMFIQGNPLQVRQKPAKTNFYFNYRDEKLPGQQGQIYFDTQAEWQNALDKVKANASQNFAGSKITPQVSEATFKSIPTFEKGGTPEGSNGQVKKSWREGKKLAVYMNGWHHFGDSSMQDYRSHKSEKRKDAYYSRHAKNLKGDSDRAKAFRIYSKKTWEEGGMFGPGFDTLALQETLENLDFKKRQAADTSIENVTTSTITPFGVKEAPKVGKLATDGVKNPRPKNNYAWMTPFGEAIAATAGRRMEDARQQEASLNYLNTPINEIPQMGRVPVKNVFQEGGEFEDDLTEEEENFLLQEEQEEATPQQEEEDYQMPSLISNTEDNEEENFAALFADDEEEETEDVYIPTVAPLPSQKPIASIGQLREMITGQVRKQGTREQAMHHLVNVRGVSPIIAAGIVGNIEQESSFKTTSRDQILNNDSVGLAQWHSSRRKALEEYAKKRGKHPLDFITNLDFILDEGQISQKALSAMSKAKTPAEAAVIFSNIYEKPNKKWAHNHKRQEYANKAFQLSNTK